MPREAAKSKQQNSQASSELVAGDSVSRNVIKRVLELVDNCVLRESIFQFIGQHIDPKWETNLICNSSLRKHSRQKVMIRIHDDFVMKVAHKDDAVSRKRLKGEQLCPLPNLFAFSVFRSRARY